MDLNRIVASVEEAARVAEVRAVANLIRQTGSVQLGQAIDYRLDSEETISSFRRARSLPYRLTVEKWHVEAAERMLEREANIKSRRSGRSY